MASAESGYPWVSVATKKSCCLVPAMTDVMHEVITAGWVGELLLILLLFGAQGACLQVYSVAGGRERDI